VVSTPGHKGLRVQAHGADWSSPVALTGEATEYGAFAASITPLDADYYIVTVDGVEDENGRPAQLEARVQVDKRSIPLVEFVFVPPPAQEAPPPPAQAEAAPPAAGAVPQEASPAELPPAGERVPQEVNLAAAMLLGGASNLAGLAPDGGGRPVRMIDAVGNERWSVTDAEGRFVFEELPPGVYSVSVDGGYQHSGVELDGAADVEILFSPVIAIWETAITNAGSMPGFSSVQVEVEGMPNLPVRIWQGEEEGLVARTGSSSAPHKEPREHVVEFRGLAPGRYLVEPEGLGVWAEVEITGLEALWVSFRRRTEAVGPNEVRRAPRYGRGVQTPAGAGEAAGARGSLYVFLAGPVRQLEQQLALLRFVAAQGPQVGGDLAQAARADVVLLLEDDEAPSDLEQQLLLRNVVVKRPQGDWGGFFAQFGG
jgi:hypothetical protein